LYSAQIVSIFGSVAPALSSVSVVDAVLDRGRIH
jgi:hypothetical protein